MSRSVLDINQEKIVKMLLADIRRNEEIRARYEAEHPELCAYDRVEQTLRSLLTGQKLSFSIMNGDEVIISTGRKITNTLIKRLIEGRRNFTTDFQHPHILKKQIERAFRTYDDELEVIAAKH